MPMSAKQPRAAGKSAGMVAASDGCRATNRAAKLAAVARKAKSSIGPKRAVRRPFAEGISRITDLCFDLWPIRIVAKSQRGEIDAKASPMPSRGTAKNVTHCRRPRLAGHSSARWQRQRFALGRDCVNRALKVLPTPLLLHFWLGSRTGGALIDPSSETLEVASLKEDNDRRRYFAANCGSIQGGTLQIGSIEPVADPVLRRSVQGVFRAMKPDDEGIDLLRRSGHGLTVAAAAFGATLGDTVGAAIDSNTGHAPILHTEVIGDTLAGFVANGLVDIAEGAYKLGVPLVGLPAHALLQGESSPP